MAVRERTTATLDPTRTEHGFTGPALGVGRIITVSGGLPDDATLQALAGLNATPGLVEQTGVDTFTKRPIGISSPSSIPTLADNDARYAALIHTQVAASIIDFQEAVEDLIGASITAGTNVVVNYNDTTGKVTINASSGGGGGVNDGDWGDVVVSGAGTIWTLDPTVVTAAARTVLDDASVSAMRTTLDAVAKTGDTITGNLILTSSTPSTSPTTGAVIITGGVGVGGSVYAGGGANIAASLTVGGSIVATAGSVGANTNFIASSTTAVLAATGAGSIYLRPNGVGNNAGETSLATGGNLTVANEVIALNFAPKAANGGFRSKNGNTNVVSSTEWFNFAWSSPSLFGYINTTSLGTVTFASDYRMKQDVTDLPSMWSKAKALRPVSYTHNDWVPEWELERIEAEGGAPVQTRADGKERWGFIAHELQETLIEDAATGVKDEQNLIQSPNPWTVLAVLTKALQEAMARIETLESGVASKGGH